MEEKRNILERSLDASENVTGERHTADDLADRFHLYGAAKRAQLLNDLDTEAANDDGEISSLNENALRRLAEQSAFHSRLKATHKRLLKVRR